MAETDAVYGQWNSIAGLNYHECYTCGAWVTAKNTTQHNNFHATFTNRKDLGVSRVQWCDYGDNGGHPFKAGIPGSATFNGTEYDDNGAPVDTTMDACPDHNPLNIRREAARLQISDKHYRDLTDHTDPHTD